MASSSQPPNLEVVKSCFRAVDVTTIDQSFDTMKKILEAKMAQKGEKDNPSKSFESTCMWDSFIKSGETFLLYLDQEEKFGQTVDLFQSRGQVLCVISGILEKLGPIYWAVAGLSMIGHLLKKLGPLSQYPSECLQLLQYLVDLAYHMNKLRRLFSQEKEKLKSALVITVKGCMLCTKQLYPNKRFSFLRNSLDSTNLNSLSSEMNAFYQDFLLTAQIGALEGQPERLPIKQPVSPANAGVYKKNTMFVLHIYFSTFHLSFQ
ncbi:uncharacterized protein LOC131874730 [Cryptomeria japonica]|uniref:uncharacterized protein LOC131874730 n=1 Tax=Cryptomeria japonica TaxID=3369 RepID=UPI0027DA93BE|nr:uncharacterized protein LOC131874730 [Cryptomeria japonica]